MEVAKFFSSGFNVNYGDVVDVANTTITVFILEPEDFIKEGFGLEKEIMLVLSHFETMEGRTIHAAETLFDKYPFKNRVDNLCYFLISEDDNVENWVSTFYDSGKKSRIIFPFSANELKANNRVLF